MQRLSAATTVLRIAIMIGSWAAPGMCSTLFAPAYLVEPCEAVAGGCPDGPRNVMPRVNFDYAAAYEEFRISIGGSPVPIDGIGTIDSTPSGWIIGWVDVQDGSTSFVATPEYKIICCTADTPFHLWSISDDGYLLGTDRQHGPFVSHISTVDHLPTNFALNLVFTDDSPVSPVLLREFGSLYDAGAGGVLYGTAGGSFVLVPIPEPVCTPILLVCAGLVWSIRRGRCQRGTRG